MVPVRPVMSLMAPVRPVRLHIPAGEADNVFSLVMLRCHFLKFDAIMIRLLQKSRLSISDHDTPLEPTTMVTVYRARRLGYPPPSVQLYVCRLKDGADLVRHPDIAATAIVC